MAFLKFLVLGWSFGKEGWSAVASTIERWTAKVRLALVIPPVTMGQQESRLSDAGGAQAMLQQGKF